MNLYWLGVMVVLTGITAVADSFLNSAGDQKPTNVTHLAIGLVIYLVTGFMWFTIYKHLKFSVSGAIYGVLTIAIFTLIGVFYWRESLRPTEIVGIIMAACSILLLSRFN